MNKHSETIIHGNTTSSVAVIKYIDGSMLNLQPVTALPCVLKGKYFVPSPSDMMCRSPHQRLYVLACKSLTQLKMRTDVNLENADELINNMSDDTLVTVC